MTVTRRLWVIAVCLVACGGGNASTPAPVALPSASVTAGNTPPTHVGRGPSEALLRVWPAAVDMTVYADLEGLSHTTLFEGLAATLVSVDPDHATCIRAFIANAKEAAAGGRGPDSIAVFRFDKNTPSLRDCVNDFEAKSVTVSNDGIVVYGNNPQSPRGAPTNVSMLQLQAGEYAVAHFQDAGMTADVRVIESGEHFAVKGAIDMPDENQAAMMEAAVTFSPDAYKAMAPSLKPDEVASIERLIRAFHVTRKQAHLDVLFDLREPPLEQARDIGVAAAVAIQGVRKYLLASKEAEALNTIGAITKDIQMDWERDALDAHGHNVPVAKKKLGSFPAVPKTVPRGVKYQSTPDDWRAWAPLRFTMEYEPQYYQYEVRAAPDGESAEVIAHGDLNGDGKTSTFKLSLRVDRQTKSIVVSPSPVTIDPDE